MIPWLSILFEAGMAALMAALIVYCVKLNRRLTTLRSQDAEINQLIASLRDAAERADVSVQRLKAAGLAAERSLRSAIEDAPAVQARLTRPAPAQDAVGTTAPGARSVAAPSSPVRTGAAAGRGSAPAKRAKRDMLMAGEPSPQRGAAAAVPAERPTTREEAEETLLQAIRSARGGV